MKSIPNDVRVDLLSREYKRAKQRNPYIFGVKAPCDMTRACANFKQPCARPPRPVDPGPKPYNVKDEYFCHYMAIVGCVTVLAAVAYMVFNIGRWMLT